MAQIPHAVDLADLAAPGAATSSGHRVAIGSGGSSERVLVDLERTGGGWLVVGPRGSGRTTALRTVVGQLLTAGVPVATVGGDWADPRLVASLTRDDGEALVRRAQQHDGLVVVVDDAELIADAPIEEALRQYAAYCAAGGGTVLASSTTAASTRPRGIVGHLARNRHGLLLQPTARSDGDVFGLRVPALTRVPGRGYVIGSEGAQEVQVATLDLALGGRPR